MGEMFNFGMAVSLFVSAGVLVHAGYTLDPAYTSGIILPTLEVLYGLGAPLSLGCGAIYVLDVSDALTCALRRKLLGYICYAAGFVGALSLCLLMAGAGGGVAGMIALVWLYFGGLLLNSLMRDRSEDFST
jgi:hypothetical protein